MTERLKALEERMDAAERWMEATDGHLERMYETADRMESRLRQDSERLESDLNYEVDLAAGPGARARRGQQREQAHHRRADLSHPGHRSAHRRARRRRDGRAGAGGYAAPVRCSWPAGGHSAASVVAPLGRRIAGSIHPCSPSCR